MNDSLTSVMATVFLALVLLSHIVTARRIAAINERIDAVDRQIHNLILWNGPVYETDRPLRQRIEALERKIK